MSKTKTEPADMPPVADDEQKRIAMAQAMLENQKRKREAECGAEINAALDAIMKKHKCQARFMELRENGQTTRIWIQPIALD